VVTCVGESFAGRVAASLLKAAGLPELVTNTLEEYRLRALELARDGKALAGLKDKLALARSAAPLFDTPRTTRHLEAAYEQMWRRSQEGLEPCGFTLAQA
jgi:protein O-GlcNAc transferase